MIIGHPKYELLFVAKQVANVAGLQPQAVQNVRRHFKDSKGLFIRDLLVIPSQSDRVSLVTTLGPMWLVMLHSVDLWGKSLHSSISRPIK